LLRLDWMRVDAGVPLQLQPLRRVKIYASEQKAQSSDASRALQTCNDVHSLGFRELDQHVYDDLYVVLSNLLSRTLSSISHPHLAKTCREMLLFCKHTLDSGYARNTLSLFDIHATSHAKKCPTMKLTPCDRRELYQTRRMHVERSKLEEGKQISMQDVDCSVGVPFFYDT
jgi:hypothetical protein